MNGVEPSSSSHGSSDAVDADPSGRERPHSPPPVADVQGNPLTPARRRWRRVTGAILGIGLGVSLPILGGGCGLTLRPDVRERLETIEAKALETQLSALLEIGPRAMADAVATEKTLDFFRSRLEEYGYLVTEHVTTFDVLLGEGGERRLVENPTGENRVVNLYAELQGTEEPNRVVEIGAHYDTVPNVLGADDNGTGVIGVLEVARVLADHKPRRTIRFCFFGGEEGGLYGSTFHVASFEEDDRREEGIVVLEMIGYATDAEDSQDAPIRIPLIASLPYVGNFILVVGNMGSGGIGNLYEKAIDAYVEELPYYSANRIGGFFGDAARSDHSPYWRAGYRGIMVTDTANFRNPHYHQKSDTINTINFEFMQGAVRAAAACLVHWADGDG